jgi:PAS domain S-box-containing protein
MSDPTAPAAPAFLAGGGIMGELIRAYDWSSSRLGPPQLWPVPLRTAIRLLLTTNHPVFLFWGPDHICFYNDAYSNSLGPERHPAILGAAGRDAWNEIWDIIGPQIDYVMGGKGATWHENHWVPITRHGRREDVYWTYSYSPIDDDTAPGGVGGALVLCTETTAQVLTAERMKAAEARWRELFAQTPGFMCMLSGRQHVFEFANPRYFDLIGRHDIIGRAVADVLPWTAEQGFIGLLDRVYASGDAHAALGAKVALPGPDGSTDVRYLDFVYQPIRDERAAVTGIFVLGMDVTQRKVAEAALGHSEERLRLARDAARIGIHDYDVVSDTVSWDARVRAIWGVEPDEPISFDVFMAGLHPDDRAATRGAVERALDPCGDGRYFAEYRVIHRKDRQEHWVHATGQVTFDDGHPVRLVGTVQDITERKHNEDAVRLADRRKSEFLATLSHELRNPLAPICNALQVLQVAEGDPDAVRGALAVIERQLSHLVRMIDDLTDGVRITRGRLDLRRETVELEQVVHDAMETAAPLLQRFGQELAVSLPPGPVPLQADRVRMAQVLSNLLINASKYSDPGATIRVDAVSADGMVEVRVIDRGIGISREHLPRVFEMFSQVETAMQRSHGGLGIGLSLARGLVELHGGTIEARSDGPGRGAEFVVRLPFAPTGSDDHEPHGEASMTGRPSPIAGRRILVVDDNEDAAATLAILLRLEQAEVEVAADGPEAMARAESFAPEIILLDIGLPGLSGIEVCELLRERDGGSRTLIVALTGWGQQEDRERTAAAGFDGHLVKPVEYDHLIKLVAELQARP